jgi:hypothetical protein
VPDAPASGNDAVYFQYFDVTEQASFLYDALERTIEKDLDAEISFLVGFDRARKALHSIADWPGQSADLFINLVRQHDGKLSQTKRRSQFPMLGDEEIAQYEAIVARAFDAGIEEDEILG